MDHLVVAAVVHTVATTTATSAMLYIARVDEHLAISSVVEHFRGFAAAHHGGHAVSSLPLIIGLTFVWLAVVLTTLLTIDWLITDARSRRRVPVKQHPRYPTLIYWALGTLCVTTVIYVGALSMVMP
jgi:hypothetical protein